MNKVVLIGRATKDWELRYTPSGVAVANGTIAVDKPVAQGKEKEADFINLQAWKQTAEACANYIKKGHRFAVDGRINTRNYENNEGRRIYITEVIVERVEFLEPKEQRSDQQSSRSDDPFKNDGKPIDISDSDLPF